MIAADFAATIERLADVSCTVGESPVWASAQNAWLWVDIAGKRIWRLDAGSGVTRSWRTDEMPACIAVADNGDLIAGMETSVFALRLGDGDRVDARRLATAPDLAEGMRFNDGRCDRQGRFWSGTMWLDMAAAKPVGRLYRYTLADGLSTPVVDDLIVQNGLAWSPDGRTMYLSDSHPSRRLIWAFDYDIETGMPRNRRIFVDMNLHRGRPDGAAVDADGCYWTCANDGACLLRFTPDGALDRCIALPLAKPSMCAFGGSAMDQLLVTSIRPAQADAADPAGSVLILRPGVKGLAETAFRTRV